MLTVQHRDDSQLRLSADSEEDTREFGRRLAQTLPPGSIVALVGDLGAGKTRLVQAFAVALDVPPDEVNSPTFTLVQEYAGRIPLRHCDTYRLRNPEEFLDLGLDELFARDGIAFVEWADRVTHLLPPDVLTIRIEITSPDSRQFQVEASGVSSRAACLRLADLLAAEGH
ncbi:MAG: tRNA (adenosine(37)-N6)-threonylcarbamoyltransferase complex ATPase subunit type 1 TsaE [Planctomycetota bacterium]